MEAKDNRKVKYTKMVLKNSIVEILKNKPLSKITVKELCDLSDINRGTFYTHYRDVYDLMEKISQEFFKDISSYLSSFVDDENNDYDYTDIVKEIFEYIHKNSALCSAILSDNASIDIVESMKEMIEKDVMYLDLSPILGKDTTELMYSYISYGCLGLIKTWIVSGFKKTTDEMTEIALKLVNKGILSFGQ